MPERSMQDGVAQVKPLPSMLSNAPYEHLLPAVEQAALEAMKLQHTMGSGTAPCVQHTLGPLQALVGTQLGCESTIYGLLQLWGQLA